MAYKISLILLIIGTINACTNSKFKQEFDVQRYSINKLQVICDSIESVMPGEMYVSGDYLLWTDPINSDKFVHILDIETGKEIGKEAQRGEGPLEFISPKIEIMPNNKFYIYDLFSGRDAVFSIDSCVTGKNAILQTKINEIKDMTSFTFMGNEDMIVFCPSSKEPFTRTKQKQTFGKLPFKGDISNSYDHFQGIVKYNPLNGCLYYSTFKFPYFALYQKEDNFFKLKKEELRTNEYKIKDNNLLYSGSKRGPIGVTLTSDYIVTIENDPKEEATDYFKIGRDLTKLPHTVCIYDYDLQLRKVINLGMPVVRLASSQKDNTLYFLGVNPDFILYKIEL